MRRTLTALALTSSLVTAVAVAGPTAPAQAEGSPDTSVAAWDAIGVQAWAAAALTPAEGYPIAAYQSVAVYDAVMAIRHGYQPFAVATDAPDDASAEAAVAAAAHRILVHYLPGQAATIIDPAYTQSLAGIPDGQSKADGVAVGEHVAAEVIAQRADDGFRAPASYTPPDPPVPGVWLPTAPTPPIGVYLGGMRPFAIASADQFRPAAPPALSSKAWARDYAEVKEIGERSSATRTAEQTLAARFWAEPPVQQTRAALRRFITDRGLDVVDAARFMAMASVSQVDAFIGCFEAKYHYAHWRPVTAIRAGDTDGNDATVADPSWTPLLGVPNHPEYPSAHSCITPAGAMAAARFLGTDEIDYTVPSITGLGDRHFATVKDLRTEVTNARIWGGIHFRSAVEAGTQIAKRTANYVLARHFKAVD